MLPAGEGGEDLWGECNTTTAANSLSSHVKSFRRCEESPSGVTFTCMAPQHKGNQALEAFPDFRLLASKRLFHIGLEDT